MPHMSTAAFWTPEEIDYLENFLMQENGPANTMDVSMLDGYLPKSMPRTLTPVQPLRRDGSKLGRYDPCHCGNGRTYKHCHGAN